MGRGPAGGSLGSNTKTAPAAEPLADGFRAQKGNPCPPGVKTGAWKAPSRRRRAFTRASGGDGTSAPRRRLRRRKEQRRCRSGGAGAGGRSGTSARAGSFWGCRPGLGPERRRQGEAGCPPRGGRLGPAGPPAPPDRPTSRAFRGGGDAAARHGSRREARHTAPWRSGRSRAAAGSPGGSTGRPCTQARPVRAGTAIVVSPTSPRRPPPRGRAAAHREGPGELARAPLRARW